MPDPDVPIQKSFPDEPMDTSGVYTGPFRAKVKKNDDREIDNKFLGQIKVWIPQVHGEEYEDRIDELPWAWPCFLHAFKDPDDEKLKAGFFGVPPEESWVYVIFENGDPDHPIYLGGWYGGEKGDTELDTFMQEDERSSARYPDIIGYISPHDGRLRFRILKEDRFEFSWWQDDEEQAIMEFDSVGYPPNNIPTIRVEAKNDWMVKVKAAKNIEMESDETVKITCKRFEVEAEELVQIESEGSSTYKAAAANNFEGASINGKGTPNGGFDRWGVTPRSGGSS
jgi:hypothetical protein